METNSKSTVGPQRRAETQLKPGNRVHVGPQPTVDDARQARVPDARLLSNTSETPALDCSNEVHREATSDFADLVGRDAVRPVDTQFPRGRSGGARHSASVPDHASDISAVLDRTRRWSKQVDDYAPRINKEAWSVIRPHLLGWMEKIGPAPTALTKGLLFNLTRLAVHCFEQGWALDPETVLSEPVVEHHISIRARKGQVDNPHARTSLRQARLALIDGEQLGVKFTARQQHRSPAPFAPSEYAGIESWAKSRRDPHHRRTACAIAALGMGAGLRAEEMVGVRRSDVQEGLGGLSVQVTVNRPRLVPLLHDWEPLLRTALDQPDAGDYLIGVTGKVSNGNYVGEFTTTTGGPSSMKMRGTWLVTHLQFGTPLDLLLATAGNATPDSFQRYLDYVSRDTDSADRLMRGAGMVR